MKTTNEVKIGERYLCKVKGKETVVVVAEIDKSGYKNHSTVRIVCREEHTTKQVIVRAPSRLIDNIP